MAATETPVLAMLPSPYEFLDLEDGKSITLSIIRGQLGMAEIHPKEPSPRHIRQFMRAAGLTDPPAAGTPITVPIPVLRVFGHRVDAPSPLAYWDISSLTLTADLAPRVNAIKTSPLVVTITAHGYKPHKRFTVEQI